MALKISDNEFGLKVSDWKRQMNVWQNRQIQVHEEFVVSVSMLIDYFVNHRRKKTIFFSLKNDDTSKKIYQIYSKNVKSDE